MKRSTLFVLLATAALSAACLLPRIQQSQSYHNFSNRTAHLGIANFWNVMSNAVFLAVAVAVWPRVSKNDMNFRMLVAGIALTCFGSAYYHWQPSDARLMWDRLPMTIVFMCILTRTIGERIDALLAERIFWPLLMAGAGSVVYWRVTGDLRPYVLVQFFPLIAVPVMLCLPSSSALTSLAAQWSMIGFYGLAKAAELLDGRLSGVPGGAHAWKHVLAAGGLWVYTRSSSCSPPECTP